MAQNQVWLAGHCEPDGTTNSRFEGLLTVQLLRAVTVEVGVIVPPSD